MKKWLSYVLAAFFALTFVVTAKAQDDVWARVKEVNFPKKSLQASWNRIYRSPMLQDDILSEGKVYLRQPDALRWETEKPVKRVTELDSTQGKGRFRMPDEKDFKITVLEGDTYSVQLTPLRRDLKQLVGQITLTVEKKSYKLLYVTILGVDGDWTQITFSNVKMDE
ncbi:MAG: outer membrane lipoprotein carrier protein LolA [Bacteroidales bacterium]|nr:outer membrane lipoprotein carrier protein LolA [Bacteroidales bacterium]